MVDSWKCDYCEKTYTFTQMSPEVVRENCECPTCHATSEWKEKYRCAECTAKSYWKGK